MISLYVAGRQLTKVRGLMLMSLVCAVFGVWWAIGLAGTGDAGVGAFVAALGIAFAVGMGVYGGCYASRIDLDSPGQQLHVHTVRFLGSAHHFINVSDIGGGRWHDGGIRTVRAPWVTFRIPGRRLPLIIDAQGIVHHRDLMQQHFGWGGDSLDD